MGVLAVEGRDAGAFLQSQTMNDAMALSPGEWQWNGWLSPKGRLIALFLLVREAPEQWLLVLPDFAAAELAALLQRFVFRSQLRLVPAPGLQAAAGPVPKVGARQWSGGRGDGIGISLPGPSGSRGLWLLAAEHPALAPGKPALDQAWFSADLAIGLPRLPLAGREVWTPQMLSLERLDAFSLAKGCYPGQEIVARTHYLGQAKRALAHLEGIDLKAGAAVEALGGAAGTVVCATADGRGALAVLALDAQEPLVAGGLPCRRLPLPALPGKSG
ncbi:MAG: folate-binding protein YgfZ [Arenimonas sp.]|nr:folate-binding protein YgfZ [Arenimonas sp.]